MNVFLPLLPKAFDVLLTTDLESLEWAEGGSETGDSGYFFSLEERIIGQGSQYHS